MVPSIGVMPRVGSFALELAGRVRNIHEPAFALSAGRKSFALKRILETVFVICLLKRAKTPFLQVGSHTWPDLTTGKTSSRRLCFLFFFLQAAPGQAFLQ
jgi:hypothetical protein